MIFFLVIFWVIRSFFEEKELKIKIVSLESKVIELQRERRVILADDIERLEWFSLELPPGTNVVDKDGVREMSHVPVLSFIPKDRKVING